MEKQCIEQEILSLASKTSKELRQMYESASQSKAPPYRREYFIRWIAHWLQVKKFGELSEKAVKKLDYLAEEMRKGKKVSSENIVIGTRISKEYHGEKHEVTVRDRKLFIYKGQPYRSLSAIATKITGTKWNGLVFFGVKNVKTN